MRVDVRLSGLNLYPVKSCAGIAASEATLTPHGLEWDREWMVVDPDGQFLTQRGHPRMAQIRTAITADSLILEYPGVPSLAIPLHPDRSHPSLRVSVWKDSTEALDCGRGAAEWMSAVLGTPARLVQWNPECRRPCPPEWTGGVSSEARFADAYPYLLLSEATLADLNQRIPGGGQLPMNRFRPNLVIEGCEALAEDALTEFESPAAAFRAVKPCTRCSITTTDQETTATGPEPLRTLSTYRKDSRFSAPVLGQNLILIRGSGERIRVGDRMTLSARA
jgi:uncharacterized protein YcbX